MGTFLPLLPSVLSPEGGGDRGNYFWKQSQPFIFTAGARGNLSPLPLHFSRTGSRRAARAALRRGTGRRRIGGAGGHGVPAAGLEGWERGTSGRGRRKRGWKTGGGSKGPHPLCRAGSVRQPGAGSLGGTQPPLPPGWVSGSPSHEVGLVLEKAGAGKPLGMVGQMDGWWDRQQGAWQLQKSWLLACPGKLTPPQGCCPGPAHTGIGESGARPQGRRHGLLPARLPAHRSPSPGHGCPHRPAPQPPPRPSRLQVPEPLLPSNAHRHPQKQPWQSPSRCSRSLLPTQSRGRGRYHTPVRASLPAPAMRGMSHRSCRAARSVIYWDSHRQQ